MSRLSEVMTEIVETGFIIRDRVNCLKSGLEMISDHGAKMSKEDLIEIAQSTLAKYYKMP